MLAAAAAAALACRALAAPVAGCALTVDRGGQVAEVGPVTGATGAAGAVVLAGLHLVVGAVVIPLLPMAHGRGADRGR